MSPVTTATNTPPVTETAATPKTPTSSNQSKPAATAASQSDAVQLSSAAQAALKEMTETPAQTAREASGGDIQAKRLLAKEVAQKAAEE